MKPIEIWGPRVCPHCGAEPYIYCKSASGRKAGLPHRERYPEDPPRLYGERQRRHKLQAAKAAERRALEPHTGMPLDLALRDIEQAQMEAFRIRQVA